MGTSLETVHTNTRALFLELKDKGGISSAFFSTEFLLCIGLALYSLLLIFYSSKAIRTTTTLITFGILYSMLSGYEKSVYDFVYKFYDAKKDSGMLNTIIGWICVNEKTPLLVLVGIINFGLLCIMGYYFKILVFSILVYATYRQAINVCLSVYPDVSTSTKCIIFASSLGFWTLSFKYFKALMELFLVIIYSFAGSLGFLTILSILFDFPSGFDKCSIFSSTNDATSPPLNYTNLAMWVGLALIGLTYQYIYVYSKSDQCIYVYSKPDTKESSTKNNKDDECIDTDSQ